MPGAVDVLGTADAAANVTVNDQATTRKADYFYKELAVSNTAAPVYSQINVVGAKNNYGAGGEDAIAQQGGRVYAPQSVEAYAYDADGNLTNDGRWTYTWDAENRLTSLQAIASVPVEAKRRLEFAYDYMGRRIQKKVYGWNVPTSTYQLQSTTKFVYDGWNLVAELDGSNILIRSYVRGGGELLLVNGGGNAYQVGYDGNQSVGVLIKASDGSVSAAYDYDPFGQTVKAVGQYASQNPFRFSGKYADIESGLIYYGYRYYDPSTGRWVSRDPAEELGGTNLYAFVSNDAANHFDALGLKRFRITGTAFIPWEWVQMPEPPPVDVVVGPVALLLDGFVHGDGRGPGEKPGGSYRLTASVEVEVLEELSKSGVVDPPFTNNGESLSQIRTAIGGYVIKEQRARGSFTPPNEAIKVKRLNSCLIQIDIKMSGNVPAKVAGIPFNIDYEYFILLRQKADGKYVADMSGFHDGFPGHEMFLESEGRVLFTRHYLPSWFASEPPGKGTAHPSTAQAARGGLALSGQSDLQKWHELKEY